MAPFSWLLGAPITCFEFWLWLLCWGCGSLFPPNLARRLFLRKWFLLSSWKRPLWMPFFFGDFFTLPVICSLGWWKAWDVRGSLLFSCSYNDWLVSFGPNSWNPEYYVLLIFTYCLMFWLREGASVRWWMVENRVFYFNIESDLFPGFGHWASEESVGNLASLSWFSSKSHWCSLILIRFLFGWISMS